MKKTIILMGMGSLILLFSACYKNKADIEPAVQEAVSYKNDISPIIVNGCGCHHSSAPDLSTYEKLTKNGITTLTNKINGLGHPGGNVNSAKFKAWLQAGAPNN